MLEFIYELTGEFVLQVVAEALVELGLHSIEDSFHRDPNP
jgi:hypothetical protein